MKHFAMLATELGFIARKTFQIEDDTKTKVIITEFSSNTFGSILTKLSGYMRPKNSFYIFLTRISLIGKG